MPIFTKVTMKRSEMYDKFLEIVANGGWEVFDVGSQGHVIHSMGTRGNTKMEFKVSPFIGGSPAYDIRTGEYASANFIYIKDFDKISKTWSNYGTGSSAGYNFTLPFYKGSYPNTTSYQQQVDRRTVVDVYFYVTKDVIIWYSVYPSYITTTSNAMFMIGIPQELFLEERTTGNYSGMVFVTNAGSQANVVTSLVSYNTPKNYLESDNIQSEITKVDSPLKELDADNQINMTDVIYGASAYGYRGRLGYFYITPASNMIDGDIIELNTPTGVEKYVRISLYFATNSYSQSFLPSANMAVALRIE